MNKALTALIAVFMLSSVPLHADLSGWIKFWEKYAMVANQCEAAWKASSASQECTPTSGPYHIVNTDYMEAILGVKDNEALTTLLQNKPQALQCSIDVVCEAFWCEGIYCETRRVNIRNPSWTGNSEDMKKLCMATPHYSKSLGYIEICR